MHYWNQTNFAGLASIGSACAAEEHLKHYGNYCLLREKGLRKQATQEATTFATHLQSLKVSLQREIACNLVQLQQANPGVHQLLPHPIKAALLRILETWHQCCSNEVEPLVSLGLLSNNIEHFEAALKIQPDEQTAIVRLVQFHLSNIDFQTHHLSESRFIGSVEEAHQSLSKAGRLIENVRDEHHRVVLQKELEHHQELISEWSMYCERPQNEPFSEWSRKRGHTFEFPTIVYYQP
jgi:hypothetical protein